MVDSTATESKITKNPQISGGVACVKGTRIPVWALIEARRMGISEDRMLRMYPALTKADLHAAWEYAAANADEITALLAD